VLQKKIERFAEEKSKMKQYTLDHNKNGIIKLNVGGSKFFTTLATLTSNDGSTCFLKTIHLSRFYAGGDV
jgi:hypothetical protein